MALSRAARTFAKREARNAARSFATLNIGDGLTDDQIALQELAVDFMTNEIKPNAEKWDEEHICPMDTIRAAAELGFGGLYTSTDYGGCGLTRLDTAVVFEALSMGCVSTTAFLTIHNMTCWLLDTYASQELKDEFLARMTTCELMGSYCLTESSSGSDAASLRTTARKEGGKWILNGNKQFISGGGHNDLYFVMARSGDNTPKGISCFLIPKDAPGLSFGAPERKMGWNSQPTAAVNFDNCEIPESYLIGEEGQGFKIAMSALDGGRVNIASTSLGAAQACLDQSLAYVKERKQFGKDLAQFQNTQFTLADMATTINASRLALRDAARRIDAGDPNKTMYAAMCKRLVTDECFDVCNTALQLHGGYGYLKDYQVERFVRDVRVNSILEGTNQVMRIITSRALLAD